MGKEVGTTRRTVSDRSSTCSATLLSCTLETCWLCTKWNFAGLSWCHKLHRPFVLAQAISLVSSVRRDRQVFSCALCRHWWQHGAPTVVGVATHFTASHTHGSRTGWAIPPRRTSVQPGPCIWTKGKGQRTCPSSCSCEAIIASLGEARCDGIQWSSPVCGTPSGNRKSDQSWRRRAPNVWPRVMSSER